MQRMIKLELDDIATMPCGCNFAIVPPDAADNLRIILSPEAADELVRDIAVWKAGQVSQEGGEADA